MEQAKQSPRPNARTQCHFINILKSIEWRNPEDAEDETVSDLVHHLRNINRIHENGILALPKFF